MQQIRVKQYKTWHNRVEKFIHVELCKQLKFDQTNKWYIHNLESVLEKETHEVLWDFEIQKTRPSDSQPKNKGNLPNNGLCHIGRLQDKIKRKQKER